MAESKKTYHMSSQAKEIVYNVSSYFMEEKKPRFKTPKGLFIVKTSEATGVPETSLQHKKGEKKKQVKMVSLKQIRQDNPIRTIL